MTDSKPCTNCTHYGPWTGACYRQPGSTIEVDGARSFRMIACHGDLFVQKKDVPNLTFLYDKMLDR